MIKISASLWIAAALVVFASISGHSQTVSSNHCKDRAEADCNASVACKWRSVTINNEAPKTSCVYDAKAARVIVSTQFAH